MNVFIIPSWYPSKDHPHAGIFNKEQAEALASTCPDSNFAISTWGSHDESLLIKAADKFKNLEKLVKFPSRKYSITALAENLIEYYTPSLTWTRKIFNGNIGNIIRANEKHFLSFQAQAGKINIIHAHSAYPAGWVAMELAEKYRIPFIITEHMTPFPFKDFLSRKGQVSHYLKKPLERSYCNIAVSPIQKQTLKKWSIPHLKIIPNLTNEDFFKPAQKAVQKNQDFTFFTLGRLEPQKGIPALLDAIKLLHRQGRSVKFRIGGEGSEEAKYKKIARELNISDNVEWLGVLDREQALKEYQQCDVFVLPSLHENLPLVLLEALACGKPVISTRCGGPESIINDTNGLLIAPGNSQALYQAMLHMVEFSDKYCPTLIRQDFMDRYSRKVVCQQIISVYQQLI